MPYTIDQLVRELADSPVFLPIKDDQEAEKILAPYKESVFFIRLGSRPDSLMLSIVVNEKNLHEPSKINIWDDDVNNSYYDKEIAAQLNTITKSCYVDPKINETYAADYQPNNNLLICHIPILLSQNHHCDVLLTPGVTDTSKRFTLDKPPKSFNAYFKLIQELEYNKKFLTLNKYCNPNSKTTAHEGYVTYDLSFLQKPTTNSHVFFPESPKKEEREHEHKNLQPTRPSPTGQYGF